MVLKELDQELVDKANKNSASGYRGDSSESEYKTYRKIVLSWKLSDEKKEKILDELYKRWSERLKYESRHISKMVAGPARYNAKRMDKSDKILKCTLDISYWFKDVEKQVKDSQKKENDDVIELYEKIKFCRKNDSSYNPAKDLEKLAYRENKLFIRLYKRFYKQYQWRKNSNVAKLYEKSLAGEIKEIRKEIFYEDANITAYTEGDRAYIKFLMCPKRQLVLALGHHGWWWNSHQSAWSTYTEKLDEKWVSTISTRFAPYV